MLSFSATVIHGMISQPFKTFSCLLGNAWVLPGTAEILVVETSDQLCTLTHFIKCHKIYPYLTATSVLYCSLKYLAVKDVWDSTHPNLIV